MPHRTKPLSITEINAARSRKKPLIFYDGDGLELLIRPTGIKLWRFRYYRPGSNKRTIMSFGAYPEVSLADARVRRQGAHTLLAKNIDPQLYKQTQEAKHAHTFYVVAKDWYEMKTSQPLAANTTKDIWRSMEKYVFPGIGDLPVSMLTTQQFVTLLQPLKTRGKLETLKRVLQRINEVMDFAANSGLIDINPAQNVRKAFPVPVKKHMPSVMPDQLPGLMQALAAASIDRQTRLLVEWQLLTATRPAEASNTRWNEIDLAGRTWCIPAGRMKMKRSHIIPLSSQTLAVLNVMKKISGHRTHVFPGLRNPNTAMNSQSANMALRRMGYKGVLVSHGLRAIFSTAANEAGFDPDVIETALAHVSGNEVHRAYNRSNYLEKRIILMQ